MAAASASIISSVSTYVSKKTKDIQPFIITKKQPWDGSAMVAIWKNRELYDSSQMKILKHLITSAKENSFRNTSVVTYTYPDTPIGRLHMGRLTAHSKGSLERVKRSFRHALCANLYWDIDMVNAQPTILCQLASKYDISTKNLEYYVENREQVLQKMMDYFKIQREDAKDWIIKCLFGAKIPELKFLQDELYNLSSVLGATYQLLYNVVDELRDSNKIGTFLAYVAQHEECKCLIAMNSFFESAGRTVGVLAYDGCMLLKLENEQEFPSQLLVDCENYIQQSTGYKIKLAIKQMCIPDEFQNGPSVLYKEEVDDKYMTEKFIKIMGCNLKHDIKKGLMIYDDKSGLWKTDEKSIRAAIVASNLIEHVLDGTVNYSGFVQKQDLILKQLPSLVRVESFVDTAILKSIGKLLFTNGIYDMNTRTFTELFDSAIYFSGSINFPFPSTRNPEIEAYINKLFFEDPFLTNEQAVGKYLKKLIARGLGGYYSDKTLVMCVGSSNSGKSVLFSILQDIFGTTSGTFNMNCFRYQKNSSQDEAKKNSWILQFHDLRCAFGSETSKLGIYDSNQIKPVVGNGDRITCRLNYMDEISVINMATLFLACNDIPTFFPLDTAICNRIKIIEYKLTFVQNPVSPFERQRVDLESLFINQEYKNALMCVLLDAFENQQPDPCSVSLSSAKEWVPNPTSSIKDTLENNGYTIDTADDSIYVPFSELKRVLVEAEVAKGMSDTAIGRELEKLGLSSHVVKISGKVARVRKYIKRTDNIIEQSGDPSN
jgi:hypothetical protein